ncbi:MAG: hydroxyacid dehydrogenase [Promethearchaeota archaeon]
MKEQVKIFITDNVNEKARLHLEDKGFHVVQEPTPSKDELIDKIKEYDAIIVRSATKLREEVLKNAVKLKIIGRAGAGLDNIDLEYAKANNIKVVNSPFAHAISVAEHTMALLLAITRQIPRADKAMKEGKWIKKKLGSVEIRGKVLGIIGFGHIGREFALRAKAFGMNIIVHDVVPDSIQAAKDMGFTVVDDINKLLPNLDYLSLHVPYNQATHHLIDASRLSSLKKSAIIINTSRGKVIDQDALVDILREGKIKGAALDVFKEEPVSPDDPILKLDNIVLTPHIASSTVENQQEAAYTVAKEIANFFA